MSVKNLVKTPTSFGFLGSCHFSTIRSVQQLRRPGPGSALRRKSPPSRIVFRDEIESKAGSTSEARWRHEEETIGINNDAVQPNTLLSPVHVPKDPHGVLKSTHPAAQILGRSGLVIQRQLELGNLLLGFEQANKYVIMDPSGNHIGFMAEEESGIGKMLARQWFRTHRAFTAHVFDRDEREVLRIHRPFSWINSRIFVYDPISPSPSATPINARDTGKLVGECQQQWHLWRRKYNLFLYHDPITSSFQSGVGGQYEKDDSGDGGIFTQFAYVDEPFLSWDFSLLTANNDLIGSVNRNFAGFGREIFTDTGVYALRMDSAHIAAEAGQNHADTTGYNSLPQPNDSTSNMQHGNSGMSTAAVHTAVERRGMTLDERAVMLATAVTIDFDYFSRHSHHGGGFFPFFWFGDEFKDPHSDNSSGNSIEQRPGGTADGTTSDADSWPWDNT